MANEVVASGGATGGLTDNEKMLSAVGYVWICCALPLFLVPMFAAKESRFAQYHAKQAAALYIVAIGGLIVVWILSAMLNIAGAMINFRWLGCLGTVLWVLLSGAGFVFMVIGAINAMQAKEKELPALGGLAAKLPF